MGYTIPKSLEKPRRRTTSSSKKTASRDFFELTEKPHPENLCNPLKPRQVKCQTPTKTASGVLYEHYRYTAFGEPEIYTPTGAKLATSAIDNPVLWNSRRYDADSNLYYYKYRHYKADIGRWLSRDPIEERGGVNLYGFVGNDVINLWDEYGQKECKYPVGSIGPGGGTVVACVKPRDEECGGGGGGVGSGPGDEDGACGEEFRATLAGATVWGRHIQDPFGFGTTYRSLSWRKAKKDIMKKFDKDRDGKLTKKDCPKMQIRLVGYSWGAWSALILVNKLDQLAEPGVLKIALGTLDPVKTIRGGRNVAAQGMPKSVVKAFNVYQRNGMRVPRGFNWIVSGKFRGQSVNGATNQNVTGNMLPDPWDGGKIKPVDHNTIAWKKNGASLYSKELKNSVKQTDL